MLSQQIRAAAPISFSRWGSVIDATVRHDAMATLARVRTRQMALTAAEEALDELTSTPARKVQAICHYNFLTERGYGIVTMHLAEKRRPIRPNRTKRSSSRT